jgi:preprotein translocase subunit SecG
LEQIILVVHLLVALAIIGLILLQRGKGADIGASFGAGASQTLFGSSGSGNVLTRATGWLAAVFFASSFGLAVIADSRTAGDEDLGFEIPVEETAEIAPAEAPSSDLPMVESPAESDLPAMEAVKSEPEAEAAGAEDLPATEEQ